MRELGGREGGEAVMKGSCEGWREGGGIVRVVLLY